jgi:hypothetical protein
MSINGKTRKGAMESEIITAEEFAKRLKVGRTTIHNWMQRGRLKRGVHFIKAGRVLRFFWNEEVIKALGDEEIPINRSSAMKPQPHARSLTQIRPKRGSAINWSY